MSQSNAGRPSSSLAATLTRVLRGVRPGWAEAQTLAEPARVRRVLVIKNHDQLGDFVLATPVVQALRGRYPSAQIDLVTREFLAPLARRTPGIDRVLELPRVRDPRTAIAMAARLSSVAGPRPDLAFVLNSVSRSRTADALAAWSRARLVVGRSRVGAGRLRGDRPADPFAAASATLARDPVYDLDLDVAAGSVHQTSRLLDLVRWCAPPATTRPRLVLDAAERAAAWRVIETAFAGAPVPAPRIGLHPGAANPLKCWPLESFVELAATLGRGDDAAPALMVFDSPRERGRGAALCAGAQARGVRAVLLPPGGIEHFAALSSHLDLLVCNDSGVMHIAAALGIPTLSFHSLGDPREWAPNAPTSIALAAPADITALPVSAAVEAARGLLAMIDSSPPVRILATD